VDTPARLAVVRTMTNAATEVTPPGSFDIRTEGCAWRLPLDESCAPVARSLAKEALTGLGLPDDLVFDAGTAVSELATNALQHGLGDRRETDRPVGACPPELWIHHRMHPESQLVLRVFDPGRAWRAPRRPSRSAPTGPQGDSGAAVRAPLDAEGGRGLGIVNALFGTWFAQLSRARLGRVPMPGKAVGFCVPAVGLRTAPPPHPHPTPAWAAGELHGRLTSRGIEGVHSVSGGGMAVVFVRPGLTVYCHPAAFRWRDRSGADVRRPLLDVLDVTEAVIARAEEFDASSAQRMTSSAGVTSA
jgi:histidine kinase-like protein